MKHRNARACVVERWLALIGSAHAIGYPASAPAAPAPAGPPPARLVAVRTEHAPDIDGDVRDSAWQQATPTTAFTQKFPDEGQPPSEPTELRVLYDNDALYVAFDCVQRAAPVTARLARRDRQVEADWVQVAISDGASTYEFSINAAGVLGDGVRFNDTDYSADWDGVWSGQVARHDHGWSAELQIPLRIFRRAPTSEEWRFQARRYISQRQETDEWAFIPRAIAGEVSHYGWLAGIASVRASSAVELLPYVSAGLHWTDLNPNGRALADLGYHGAAGLDLSWRLGKDLTLDASFNPDFAQVEADQLVLNLTTYETFFSEKRPFFINGMTMFQMPRMELFPSAQTLFYTRRIGAVPDTSAISGGGVTVTAEPATIYAAGKLSGQLASGVSVGVVSAVTGRDDVTVQAPGTPPRTLVGEPLAVANVARINAELTTGIHVGVLASALRRFEPDGAYPALTQPDGAQLQQCPSGALTAIGARCFHDAYVSGLDGSWRSASGNYAVAGQALVTSIQHGPPRTMADGTVIQPGDSSAAGRLYLAKEGGQWIGSVEAQVIGRRVDYNDLGYLQRQNLLRFVPYIGYRTFEPFWEIAETETHLYLSTRDNLDGVKLLRAYFAGGKVRFKNFWIVAADVIRYGLEREDRDVGDGTALQHPNGYELDLTVTSDPRRELAASIYTEAELFPGGGRLAVNGELTYQPLSRLELQLLPQLTFATGQQRFIPGERAPDEPHLLFGALRAREIGATLRTGYTFTNRLTLQLYAQLLLAGKHYSEFRTYDGPISAHTVVELADLVPANPPAMTPDSIETSLNLGAVLRWELRPGSTLFLVYSRFQDPAVVAKDDAKLDLGPLRTGPATDAIRVKLSYYWD